jgi:hypothetical protein
MNANERKYEKASDPFSLGFGDVLLDSRSFAFIRGQSQLSPVYDPAG